MAAVVQLVARVDARNLGSAGELWDVGARARARVRVRVTDAPSTCSPAAQEVASGPNVKMLPVSVITCVPVRLMHLVKG